MLQNSPKFIIHTATFTGNSIATSFFIFRRWRPSWKLVQPLTIARDGRAERCLAISNHCFVIDPHALDKSFHPIPAFHNNRCGRFKWTKNIKTLFFLSFVFTAHKKACTFFLIVTLHGDLFQIFEAWLHPRRSEVLHHCFAVHDLSVASFLATFQKQGFAVAGEPCQWRQRKLLQGRLLVYMIVLCGIKKLFATLFNIAKVRGGNLF